MRNENQDCMYFNLICNECKQEHALQTEDLRKIYSIAAKRRIMSASLIKEILHLWAEKNND